MLHLRIEEEVDEVDFERFLSRGGVAFEEPGDTDGILEVFLGHGGDGPPGLEGLAVGVGIGEEDEPVVAERIEFGDVEHREAAGGEPEGLGEERREDDGGLFGLHNTEGRPSPWPLHFREGLGEGL